MVRRNLGLPHRLISKNFNCVIWVKNNAQNTKQNQDFPNVPQTPKSEGTSEINKNQIKKASEANPDGRTENTEKHKSEE